MLLCHSVYSISFLKKEKVKNNSIRRYETEMNYAPKYSRPESSAMKPFATQTLQNVSDFHLVLLLFFFSQSPVVLLFT